MNQFKYTGANRGQISFPLGGIGTGCIGLGGDGRLIDWEIFNRPNKNSLNGFSHFAVRAESRGKVIDARVLNGDLKPPFSGYQDGNYGGFGFGPARELLSGLPHFRETVFTGEYPLAEIDYIDRSFPGRARLSAFNPFIPLNPKDSGIPAAFFEFEITNTTSKTIDYTLAATLGNPLPGPPTHRCSSSKTHAVLQVSSSKLPKKDPGYGDLSVATDADRTSCQQYWFGGSWFDSLEIYWRT